MVDRTQSTSGLRVDRLIDEYGTVIGMHIDIQANRQARKWSRKQLVGRAIWEMIGAPLFALSPRPLWVFRRALLRSFGARIASGVHVFPTVKIAIPWNLDLGKDAAVGDGAILYSLGQIRIGPRATVSQYAHLCAGTHDHRLATFPLLKAPIEIGEGAWVCADAFVGPGVNVGPFAILAARAVANKDISARTIAAGNPARPVGNRNETEQSLSP